MGDLGFKSGSCSCLLSPFIPIHYKFWGKNLMLLWCLTTGIPKLKSHYLGKKNTK